MYSRQCMLISLICTRTRYTHPQKCNDHTLSCVTVARDSMKRCRDCSQKITVLFSSSPPPPKRAMEGRGIHDDRESCASVEVRVRSVEAPARSVEAPASSVEAPARSVEAPARSVEARTRMSTKRVSTVQ